MPKAEARPADGAVALIGFILVATAQATNMILARGLAETVPPFSLAFFRWSIVALGLAPFALADARAARLSLRKSALPVVAAGFLGMFVCGAPVYIAGATTTAINIGLIMTLSPVVLLLISSLLGLERIRPLQIVGMTLALAGALLVISRGDPRALVGVGTSPGDLLILIAMLAWSGYTLLQSRVAPEAGLLARVCLFAAVGALLTLPFAAREIWSVPQAVFNARAVAAYVFAGLVPGVFAYAGFAYLGKRFGSVRASIVLYIGPIAAALLSFAVLGEPPGLIHLAGGALILGGVWASLRK
jgi:drug/metabolite transporter (DMT)-like permease